VSSFGHPFCLLEPQRHVWHALSCQQPSAALTELQFLEAELDPNPRVLVHDRSKRRFHRTLLTTSSKQMQMKSRTEISSNTDAERDGSEVHLPFARSRRPGTLAGRVSIFGNEDCLVLVGTAGATRASAPVASRHSQWRFTPLACKLPFDGTPQFGVQGFTFINE
jgi:hypothetical protein